MTEPTIIGGDLRVRGAIIPGSIRMPAGSVTDDGVAAGADISAAKLVHRHNAVWQQPNTAATAETRTIHVVRVAGIISEILAGSIAAAIGDSTVTIDVKKNGTSVLSSAIVLDNSNTARVPELGTINTSVDDVVADDWLEVVITISAGTGTLPTGVFVQVLIEEDGV